MKQLQTTLSKINELGICNKETLSLNAQLYTDLFLNVDKFITGTVLRSHANINKLSELRNLGVDIEDIRMDCLERVISKLNNVLANDLEHQIPYMYTICNNIIVDSYRKAIRESGIIISLDEALNFHKTNEDSKKSKTLNDYLMDPKASPETKYIAKAAIIEIFQKYGNNADNLLCVLAKVFKDKPRELAALLIHKGSVDKALVAYEEELTERFGISKSEFPYVSPAKVTGLSKLLSKDDPNSREVSSKISNILNRTK